MRTGQLLQGMVFLMHSILLHSVLGSPESAARLSKGRTTVQNAMWAEDAFPTSRILQPGPLLQQIARTFQSGLGLGLGLG